MALSVIKVVVDCARNIAKMSRNRQTSVRNLLQNFGWVVVHLKEDKYTAFALISTTGGAVGVVGKPSQVEDIIDRSKPEKYVMALNAL